MQLYNYDGVVGIEFIVSMKYNIQVYNYVEIKHLKLGKKRYKNMKEL